MSLSVSEQVKWWGIAGAIFVALLWFMGNTIVPFVVGAAIAYFLDPVADRLEAAGLSRVGATVLITMAAIFIFIIGVLLVLPLLVGQVQSLVNEAPSYVVSLQAFLSERFPSLLEENSVIRRSLSSVQGSIESGGVALVNTILTSSLAVIDFLILVVVAPVVAFYLLLDWDRMIAKIDGWLPREHAPVIRDLSRQVDAVLGGFVRGQLTVCLILGTFYAAGLVLIGLKFGLIVGIVAGLISFIPFVGSIIGGGMSVGLALFQFWDQPIWIAAVAGVFAIGQVVEGNYLTPKLVGSSVGLHPVWLMFALSVFGAVFGFAGMMIAVPVAAVLGVLARFFLGQYLDGRLYKGPSQQDVEE